MQTVKRRRIRRALATILLLPVVLIVTVAIAGWWELRASLPVLDGVVHAEGLSAPVTIDRDALGVPVVSGSDRADLAYATGFLHAQERFFQMDLLRRSSAGELAELFGRAALDFDRSRRLHRLRHHAEAAVAAAFEDERRLLTFYTRGVNDGLHALGARPFEYLVLRSTPVDWRPEDTMLVVYAMYFDLQYDELASTLSRAILRERLPDDMFAFLLPNASHWDAPLDQATSLTPAMPALPTSKPDWLSSSRSSAIDQHADEIAGSNSFAADGAHTGTGVAMIANDMHLGLRLPSTWYRLSLHYADAYGGEHSVIGVSLPGAPAIVVGSNGHVAWGFTNANGNFLDLVRLDADVLQSLRYRSADGGTEQAMREVERIAVKGAPPVDFPVVETRWGPVITAAGNSYAVHWIAAAPGAVSMHLMDMESANDLAAAIKVGQSSGIPTQNLLVADAAGHIGWTLAGPLPRRAAPSQRLPMTGDQSWSGLLAPQDYPVQLDPAQGRLWTANNRQLSGEEQDKIGSTNTDMGARASQIRDDLLARDTIDERGMLAIELDDRALWITFWRQLLLGALDDAALAGHPERAEMRRLVEQWNGRADIDAAGYTLVRGFYQSLYDAWFGGLDAELARVDPKASYRRATQRTEAVMEVLANAQVWMPPGMADWHAFLLNRIDAVIAETTQSGIALKDATWGHTNRAAIAHPLARFLPWPLAGRLMAPADPLPGDSQMPRVQRPGFGASERMVVSPGLEATAVFHMPGGQSGHPLSPFFLAGHQAWTQGEPLPFLAAPAVYHLALQP
ncbi:penicillin acylase family protein [Bradyrhizobium sp. STM 3557]|uniref:penicillin acylase family protein n=1 Tax=Bradyrhizobium sp. STM 3557 TaxID=578920 RepID=UPI00388CFE00